DTEAGTSCNWMGLELVYPELKTNNYYEFKIRNGTYWTARRYAKSGFIEKRFIEECPFCRNIAPETIEHMLLECSRWQALRAKILSNYIKTYKLQLALTHKSLPASISIREELKLSSTRIRKDPTVLCVKTTLATAKFLNAIALPRYLMLNKALNYNINAIGDNYVTVQHNNLKKVAYFMFKNFEETEIFVKTPTVYNGRLVDVYQTISYDKDVTIIKIQNFLVSL
ncbi:hypothetical protein BB561_004658, partial [Smittium simulii]